MATTRTPGITVLSDGRRFIDKRYLGVRIGLRVGAITQEQAEERLDIEIARVQCDLARMAHARPTFTDCAARYLAQSRGKRSIDVIKWHVTLLQSYIGGLEPQQIHDQTLEPFVNARLAGGASATTINRSLEVVRTILNRAARSYRHTDGRPWLEAMPPLITMLPESPRLPYPITWKEQDMLFRKLPAHLGRMALFAVNTGLRDSNVCGLQWTWEVAVPELGRSVFVIPSEAFKTKRSHVVVLNDIAWSIVNAQRSLHPVWVFRFRGRRINHMNNSGWQDARRDAGLPLVRVHDLRHSFACRLRAAGVSAEDREALLGHANHSMAGHYASADVGHLLKQANLLLDRSGTRTVLRVADRQRGRRDERSHTVPQQERSTWFCRPSA
jgi:integrase